MHEARARNLSPHDLFVHLGRQNTPTYGFRQGMDRVAWQEEALPRVLETLGRIPEPVDPRPNLIAEFRDGDMITQRWIIDVQPGISATLVVNRPVGEDGAVYPAILCWAGHSAFG